jgi:membrane protease YdiL (CAAX protease family)
MHPIVPMVKGPDSSPLTVVTILLIAVVLAPVLEEITFRGFFYNALRSRYSPILSIAISSAFFAGIHPQGIIGFPMLMAIGIVLATLREWRGSLIAPIIMHACTNGATLLIVLLGF